MLLVRSALYSLRRRDKDEDGWLHYREYLTSLFCLIRNYDEFSSSTQSRSCEAQAIQLLAQLDFDHDGYVFK